MKSCIYIIDSEKVCYIGQTGTSNRKYRLDTHQHYIDMICSMNNSLKPTIRILAELPENITNKERIKIEKIWMDHFRQFKQVISCSVFDKRPEWHKKRMSDAAIKQKKSFKLCSPDGDVIVFHGITEFSRTYGIHRFSVQKLLNGKQNNVRGWTKPAK